MEFRWIRCKVWAALGVRPWVNETENGIRIYIAVRAREEYKYPEIGGGRLTAVHEAVWVVVCGVGEGLGRLEVSGGVSWGSELTCSPAERLTDEGPTNSIEGEVDV